MNRWWAFLLFLFCAPCIRAQTDSLQSNAAYTLPQNLQGRFADPVVYPTKRKWIVGGASAGFALGSLVLLNEAWYQQYPKTSFHTFNDGREWLQVDKVGHAWSAYQLSRTTTALWQWAGTPQRKAVWLGSLTGLGYLSIIEFLDGHSQKWGWSWADMGANTAGTILFSAQHLAWGEQKVQFKFSALPHRYNGSLKTRADDLFGPSAPERLLKDYNSHTYWLSVNLNSFLKSAPLPSWLNVAVGYGATGMWGGFENLAVDERGTTTFDRRNIARQRQWYLSPDVDFTKIKTSRKGIKTLLQALNCIKLPAPALEWSGGRLKGKVLYF